MATYYVRKTGSNLNDGLAPSRAWATLAKALGASGISSGDTVYVGAGRYAEVVTVGMVSATAETSVIADVTGEHTGDAGPVVWTARLSGDAFGPSVNPPIDLNGRDYLTFQGFVFDGANTTSDYGMCVRADTLTSTNIRFLDCHFFGFQTSGTRSIVAMTNGPSERFDWLFDRCVFFWANNAAITVAASDASDASDYDIGLTIQNCLMLNVGRGVYLTNLDGGGVGSGKPGAARTLNCTIFSTNECVRVQGFSNGWSTTIPCVVYNSIVLAMAASALWASVTGQLVEGYNFRNGLTNVLSGAGSASMGRAYLPLLLQNELMGMMPGTMLTPWNYGTAVSPLLGFGSHASVELSADILNRPRPAGGQSTNKAVGANEAHDTARVGSALGADAGGYIELVGPADFDLVIPVDTASTTISVKVKWDATHGDTTKPQAQLLANGEIGFAGETKTATGTAGSGYETLTFSAFTPTAKGVVVLRLISRSSGGAGIAAFDTVSVS